MFVIGIISDTHGGLPRGVYKAFKDCDHIIHAGDIGAPSVLYDLEMIAPVTAVLGNCDYDEFGPEVRGYATKVFDGVRALVIHRPKDMRAALAGQGLGALAAGDPLPRIAIHGHTHKPKKEYVGAVLTLCPGSPNYPRESASSVMVLTLDAGKIVSADIIEL
ncbi:MAG: YfcE family phosphodiesterase [Coriobacteriia bacterium]|nr:YfcE family phosphodiesterase [Coriobacteriia bacterium]